MTEITWRLCHYYLCIMFVFFCLESYLLNDIVKVRVSYNIRVISVILVDFVLSQLNSSKIYIAGSNAFTFLFQIL